MSYNDYWDLAFMDGTHERVGGNRTRLADGVLMIWTDTTYGSTKDVRHFPLVSLKSWAKVEKP